MLARILILTSILFILYNTCIAGEKQQRPEVPEPKKVMQEWQVGPKIPLGWEEIDRNQEKITSLSNYDVFVLMADGKNDQIVWFEKINHYWRMTVIENVPSKNHVEYGLDIKKAKLYIQEKTILYGKVGTEAISFFEWDPQERVFIEYIPY